MPRIVKRSPLNRLPADCDTCGKHCEKPYIYQIIEKYDVIPTASSYSKSSKKTKRLDLTGDKKAITMNYCDVNCWEERPFEKN